MEAIAEKVAETQAELTEIKTQLKRSENSLVTTDFRISNMPYRENENLFHIFAKIRTTINIPIPSNTLSSTGNVANLVRIMTKHKHVLEIC